MLYGKIKNINKKISKIILGNDVKKEYPNAIKLWDHFFNKGGNTSVSYTHLTLPTTPYV